MAIEVFNRYEHKYLLDRDKFQQVTSHINKYMEMDKYNKNGTYYTISNLYLDTPDDFLIRTSLGKPEYKEKLRLRSYGIPDENSKVFLEIKKKFNGIVNKRRTKLQLPEAYRFIETGTPPPLKSYMNGQVIKELEYLFKIYDLSPKTYLAYDRIAYFEKGNPDLRISFDFNIRYRRHDLRLEKGDYGEKLLGDNIYLMEVKTALAKPLWLTHLLSDLEIYRQSFSKYGTEFKKYLNIIN